MDYLAYFLRVADLCGPGALRRALNGAVAMWPDDEPFIRWGAELAAKIRHKELELEKCLYCSEVGKAMLDVWLNELRAVVG